MIPTILVTGRDGQLGFELRRTLAAIGRVVAVDVDNVDFSDVAAVRKLVRDTRPEVIVNAAAYTAVDRAETERHVADVINGEVPGALAEELQALGGKLFIHYSTDYVFNGSSNRPYVEDDPTEPVNAYGAGKLAGEEAVRNSGMPHVIVRTEWLYTTRGGNFLLTILRLAREGKPLRIIADQVGAPTWARMLAEASAQIVARFLNASPDTAKGLSGVYHATAAGQTSWHGFTEAILQESLQRMERLKKPTDWCEQALAGLTPIPTTEYPTPAKRPAYSVLSNEKLAQAFGIRLPEWREQLRLALEDYSF
ncbi:MAG: dTDP-4-dehydrorhamnose reductase [Terriglobales bacterium]